MTQQPEEVEVHVRQLDETDTAEEAPPIADLMRRLLLASIGAVAMSYDEAEQFINRLVERGELAQKDGEKLMNQMMERVRQPAQKANEQQGKVEERIESGFEQFLNRMNIPSKNDIDDLSAKVAQLAARVEEMRRQQS
jgi:poly(hydroxyalkanoate) granule-associated protein